MEKFWIWGITCIIAPSIRRPKTCMLTLFILPIFTLLSNFWHLIYGPWESTISQLNLPIPLQRPAEYWIWWESRCSMKYFGMRIFPYLLVLLHFVLDRCVRKLTRDHSIKVHHDYAPNTIMRRPTLWEEKQDCLWDYASNSGFRFCELLFIRNLIFLWAGFQISLATLAMYSRFGQ